MSIIDLNKKIWQWLALIFLAFIWGSSFILMKKGLESFSFYQVAAIRIFGAFVFLLPFTYKRLKRIKPKHFLSIAIVGVIGNLMPALLYTKAQTQVNSTLAGMLNSLTPVFVLVIGLMFYKAKVKWHNVFGLLVAFVGAVILIYKPDSNIFQGELLFTGFIIVATLFYGISTNEIKFKLQELDGMTVTAGAFMLIGPLAGYYLFFHTDILTINYTKNVIVNLSYVTLLALFGSAVAVSIFNILIKYTTPIFAASVTYIIPIFAIIWGVLDNEIVTILQISGMVLTLFGVYLVNRKKKLKVIDGQ